MSQQTIRPISKRQRRDIFVVTPLQNAAKLRRSGIFVATPFPDLFKLRRSDIDAAPTELGLFCGEHSTKMPRLRRSPARLAPIRK